MDNNHVQLIGGPCGQHGPYTFYKAFKFTKNGEKRVMQLSEFFFVKLWMDSDLVCIGELQLLWADKNSEQVLASLRLYFLPENTPEGRMDHGEDEVLAISEKVVLRVEDLITWITVDTEWSWGRLAKYYVDADNKCGMQELVVQTNTNTTVSAAPAISARLTESSLDFSDVEKEKKLADIKPPHGPSVIILSYPRYCRYRAVLKRLEGVADEHLRHTIVNALGGIRVKYHDTRILYCKDTFDYPELEGHELLCNHLAPKLKGRPRGRRKKRSISPGSESNESESSVSNVFNSGKNIKITTEGGRNGLRCDTTRRTTRSTENNNSESKDFIKQLTAFMKNNRTPIGRIPSLGYRELNLHSFYSKVQKLGGYDSVTQNRLWKSIFDDLSGNHTSTSAATVIRRHYERFLLAYERTVKGEEYKPLPVSERRRLKSKTGSSSTSMSDAETSEGNSRSGNSTPIPQLQNPISTTPSPTNTNIEDIDNKDVIDDKSIDYKSNPSSLRSVRVKTSSKECCKETTIKEEETTTTTTTVMVKMEKTMEKDPEPITGAVAPIQKMMPTIPEKSSSPVEGKENIPIGDRNNVVSSMMMEINADLVEVPYKSSSKTPEIIDLESIGDKYASKTTNNNNNNNSAVNNKNNVNNVNNADTKRGKLDILKEGGLEVTPVRSKMIANENKPNGHKKSTAKHNNSNNNANTNNKDVEQAHQVTPTKYPFNFTLTSPPKVVQSKSIYAPSQKIVYGDPKDPFVPQMQLQQQPVHTPKFANHANHAKSMDLLDLTVKSPQKPVVEIMRVPPIEKPKLPKYQGMLLEGRRINSNLEITLVGPSISHHQQHQQQQHGQQQNIQHGQHNMQHGQHGQQQNMQKSPILPPPSPSGFQTPQKYHNYPHHQQHNPQHNQQHNQQHSQQHNQQHNQQYNQQSNQQYNQQHHLPTTTTNNTKPYMKRNHRHDYNPHNNKISRVEENGKTSHQQQQNQQQNQHQNQHQQQQQSRAINSSSYKPKYSQSLFHPQMPMPSGSNKISPSIPPMIDPIYYSSLFSHPGAIPGVPPMYPIPSPENLQYFQELLARNSRLTNNQFPLYPFPSDNTNNHASSIISADSKGKKQ